MKFTEKTTGEVLFVSAKSLDNTYFIFRESGVEITIRLLPNNCCRASHRLSEKELLYISEELGWKLLSNAS